MKSTKTNHQWSKMIAHKHQPFFLFGIMKSSNFFFSIDKNEMPIPKGIYHLFNITILYRVASLPLDNHDSFSSGSKERNYNSKNQISKIKNRISMRTNDSNTAGLLKIDYKCMIFMTLLN